MWDRGQRIMRMLQIPQRILDAIGGRTDDLPPVKNQGVRGGPGQRRSTPTAVGLSAVHVCKSCARTNSKAVEFVRGPLLSSRDCNGERAFHRGERDRRTSRGSGRSAPTGC